MAININLVFGNQYRKSRPADPVSETDIQNEEGQFNEKAIVHKKDVCEGQHSHAQAG